MDTRTKVLLTAGTLGTGCGGIPWLLNQTSYGNSASPTDSTSLVSTSSSVAETAPPVSTPNLEEQSPQDSIEPATQDPVDLVTEETPAPVPPLPVRKKNEGNCLVMRQVDELETLLWNNYVLNSQNLVDTDTFVKVVCSNTNSDQNSQMPSEWEGLFPNVLFENRHEVTENQRIGIKTETAEDSKQFTTTFDGSHFYDKIMGEWTKTDLKDGEKQVTEVRITSSKPSAPKIYLLFKKAR